MSSLQSSWWIDHDANSIPAATSSRMGPEHKFPENLNTVPLLCSCVCCKAGHGPTRPSVSSSTQQRQWRHVRRTDLKARAENMANPSLEGSLSRMCELVMLICGKLQLSHSQVIPLSQTTASTVTTFAFLCTTRPMASHLLHCDHCSQQLWGHHRHPGNYSLWTANFGT